MASPRPRIPVPFPQVTFRPIRRADVPLLLRFVRAYYRHDRIHFSARAAGAAVRALIGHPRRGRVWFICDQGRPIGYAVLTFSFSLEFGGQDGTLDELYLIPARRHRGIGACTMAFLESVARARGLRALHLEVAQRNRPARRLYEHAGFRLRERYCLMTKRLAG